MARKNEAEELLRSGNSPSEIARRMGISVASVRQYLYTQVGEGRIRRSDIVFSIPAEKRRAIEDVIDQKKTTNLVTVAIALEREGFDVDRTELKMYLDLRDSRVSLGDMYEYIREIEVTLHDMVKEVLVAEYGEGWWRTGISESIRKDCASRREGDTEPVREPYCYTTFINLSTIIQKQWNIFSSVLPPEFAGSKKSLLLQELERINNVRNRVMHPVKTHEFTEEEFCFAHHFRKRIGRDKWERPSLS